VAKNGAANDAEGHHLFGAAVINETVDVEALR
jgi:hypothetical protein